MKKLISKNNLFSKDKKMKSVMLLSFIISLSSCVSSQLNKDYYARNYSTKDEELMTPSRKQFADLLVGGSTNLMFASLDNSEGKAQGAKTIQQYYCNCMKKLGDKCLGNSKDIAEENKSLWAKGNSAEMALRAYGYEHLVDKDLCTN